mgnify:CR=1 FL=1
MGSNRQKMQGNRWLYVIVGVIVLLLAGLVYAWTVMSKTIGAEHADWSAAALSMTFTLVMAFFCIGGLIGGILSKKWSPKLLMIASAVLFFAGFYIASFTVNSPAMLYIGFGVLCGLGSGFAYNMVISTMSAWFPDKQGLISGILLMGFGFSAFFIGKIFAAAAPPTGTDEWKAVFRILGVVILIVFIICSFFFVKPGPDFLPPEPKKKKTVRKPASDINTSQLLRNRNFWLIFFWAVFASSSGLALVSQASGIAGQVSQALNAGAIATIVGLISILNGIGRVIFGMIFDRKGFRITIILDTVVFLIAAFIIMTALRSGSVTTLVAGFIIGGLAYGGIMPTNAAIISDFFGRTYYPTNFSMITLNLLPASFASTLAGKLFDITGTYTAITIMMIIATVISFVIFLLIRRPEKSTSS